MKSYHQIKTDVSGTLAIQLPTALLDLILSYVERVSFHWEELLNDKSPASLFSYFEEQFLKNFKKNFFTVLRHCEEKPNDAITLNFLDLQEYGSTQTYQTFRNGFSALEYLISTGTPVMQNRDVYNIRELLLTHSLMDNPQVMDLFKQLILELPKTTEFTLTTKDLSIMAAYLELKEEFNTDFIFGNIESKLFKGAFNSKKSEFPYVVVNADSITFIASHRNKKALEVMERFSQYKPQYLSFEQKFLNSDRIKAEAAEILTQHHLLLADLHQIICQYIPDISSLAQNLLTQLESLEERYPEEFTHLVHPEGLRIFKDALKAAVAKRLLHVNNSDFERKYEGMQDPILVISRLIEGVLLQDRCSYLNMFYLLDFFKNFNLYNGQPLGKDVEEFLHDLLEFTDTHQPIVINRKLLRRFVSEKVNGLFFTDTNSAKDWNNALTTINLRLYTYNECPCHLLVCNPASFMTLDDTDQITLYIKKQAAITISQLTKLVTTTSIHLSSLFVQQLLSQFPATNIGSNWVNCEEKTQEKVITDLMAVHFQVAPKTIQSISHFGIYGYKANIANSTYSKIRRTYEESPRLFILPPQEQKLISIPTQLNLLEVLFNKIRKSPKKSTTLFNSPPEQKRLKNPLEHAILKTIEPLEKNLHSYGEKSQALVKQQIEAFNKSLSEKFADIHNPEQALKAGHTFLKEWSQKFYKLTNIDTSSSALSKNAKQTFTEMNKLAKDISSLMQGLMTGEISLAVEVLPTSQSSLSS
jgi:hypothetical protein